MKLSILPVIVPIVYQLFLDNGDCFVGDLDPIDYLPAYSDNESLKNDWKKILDFNPPKNFLCSCERKNLDAEYDQFKKINFKGDKTHGT